MIGESRATSPICRPRLSANVNNPTTLADLHRIWISSGDFLHKPPGRLRIRSADRVTVLSACRVASGGCAGMTNVRPGRTRVESDSSARDPLCPTLFHEQWWLEAATQGHYREIIVKSGNQIVGRLPFAYRQRLGMRECILPDLTPFLGPAIDDGGGRDIQRVTRRRRIIREMLDQLPAHSRFRERLYGNAVDALFFLESNFSSSTEFTYDIAPDTSESLWRNMRDTTRNVIRRAEECCRLVELEPADFIRHYKINLHQRGKLFNYMWKSNALFLLQESLARGRAKLFGAADFQGHIKAAVFFAWDSDVSYLLLTTRSLDAHNGVVGWLLWESIKYSTQSKRIFDFGGVVSTGSSLFYASFGARPQSRIVVERATSAFCIADLGARKAGAALDRMLAPITKRIGQINLIKPAIHGNDQIYGVDTPPARSTPSMSL